MDASRLSESKEKAQDLTGTSPLRALLGAVNSRLREP